MSLRSDCFSVFWVLVFFWRKRQINWAEVRTPKVRAKPLPGFLIRRGVDGVANSLKLAHTKDPIILLVSENVMLTLA